MAIIDDETLLKLPVHTKSGTHLGRVAGFDFDIDAHAILRYRIRPKGLASRLLKSPLLIAREQVLSIDAEKMIVDDNVEKEMELAKAKAIGLVSNVKA
jgi:sporulation protein YlmC with PRC-barrel domain